MVNRWVIIYEYGSRTKAQRNGSVMIKDFVSASFSSNRHRLKNVEVCSSVMHTDIKHQLTLKENEDFSWWFLSEIESYVLSRSFYDQNQFKGKIPTRHLIWHCPIGHCSWLQCKHAHLWAEMKGMQTAGSVV